MTLVKEKKLTGVSLLMLVIWASTDSRITSVIRYIHGKQRASLSDNASCKAFEYAGSPWQAGAGRWRVTQTGC